MTTDLALEIAALSKAFGEVVAVDAVDLHVAEGSFFGLVGPNGAGKTTLLSMAVGLLRPDAGRSRAFGVDVWDDPRSARPLMGVLPDGLGLPEWLTGRELLHYFGRLSGLSAAMVAERADELLEVMDLLGAERTLLIDYSTGMRKKIGLAAALLRGPRLLVLDEPLEGVDPVSAAMIKGVLTRFAAAGGSVVLSSHVMSLVEELCDTVAVLAGGRLVSVGALDDVRGATSLEEAFVRLAGVERPRDEGLAWLTS